MFRFHEHFKNLLKQNKNFVDDDGNILRNVVIESAMKLDPKLLKILLDDEKTRQNFFTEVDGVQVFDKIKFSWLVNNKNFLPDSYTAFKNKIGLVDNNGNFISNSSNVELVFPYKDCTLEGGQTKDDQKRSEIFYHETLARDEIDTLTAPKIFTDAKKFSPDGVESVTNFSPTDNLIIKGNNLIALASLQKIFQNKIKCIYIDVPYNTGNDSFNYNDRFNHSSWLTFMKNRLELAKKLLRDDGSIWISIDDDEQAYLKVLCDEIFGRDNFINMFVWKRNSSAKTEKSKFTVNTEYILLYCKSKKFIANDAFKPLAESTAAMYNKDDNDGRGRYATVSLQKPASPGPETTYDYVDNTGKIWKCPPKGWRMKFEKVKALENDGRLYFEGKSLRVKDYWNERINEGKRIDTLWDDLPENTMATQEIKALNLSEVFATPKPERLIQRILTLATNEGDIVLDNFLGSGTTAAVAHKMKRQYIGVEQMDYIETVTVERLKKVIDGEQGGISKAVNWQGGGSFIYCELAKLNQKFVEEIQTARDFEKLRVLYEKIIHSDFISYKVDPAELETGIKEFAELSLDNQKKFLIELLDKNMLYVNYSDIDDEDYKICDADKKFTRSFYGENKNE